MSRKGEMSEVRRLSFLCSSSNQSIFATFFIARSSLYENSSKICKIFLFTFANRPANCSHENLLLFLAVSNRLLPIHSNGLKSTKQSLNNWIFLLFMLIIFVTIYDNHSLCCFTVRQSCFFSNQFQLTLFIFKLFGSIVRRNCQVFFFTGRNTCICIWEYIASRFPP